ncbi:hypothetical protein OG746_15805 [Streptomyces sp. NBC_01016]|uniref:hypothetical protein n=1 Tax=Streptomyces sp. NBC_01016 TaxID=2903720 RepID=UPI00224CCF8F|nr:hypothetical protein [Streptomyces sp. NBC_01016]MCX4830196.1 hypothetical protein [Streptomyces sp. NBC_01016]
MPPGPPAAGPSAFDPPAAGPPAFGPAQEVAFGPPGRPPVQPSDRPPARPPAGPADPARAVAAGLLNLSGLGLGYVLVRRRLLALLCVAATAALLTLALPADPDGVPGWALIGYGVLLLAAVADGARIGLRAPATAVQIKPVAAIVLGLALLAVPAGGAVAYGGLRDDAVEQRLLDRLDSADALVKKASGQDFAEARADYRTALGRYRDLAEDHPDSRAAHRVHDSLDAYYKAVSAPYADGEHCAAVAPLEHLRSVPGTVDRAVLGSLASWPDKPLAASLLKCGTGKLGAAESDGKGGELGQLLRTFPESAQADQVEPAVRAAVERRAGELKGADPCTATRALRRIGDTAKRLPAPVPAHLRGGVATAVEDGAYACGIDQFKDKKFSAAHASLTDFAGTYKNDERRARAQQVAIAAEIAKLRPTAGDRLPPKGAPGGSRMDMVISNDGPDPVEVLYTGPVTGRITIAACGSCKTYPTETAGRGKACKASGKSYPKRTLRLPAGTYHFLHKPGGRDATASGRAAGGRIQSGYSYTQCSYVVRSELGADL